MPFADVLESAGVRPEAAELGASISLHATADSAPDQPKLDLRVEVDEIVMELE